MIKTKSFDVANEDIATMIINKTLFALPEGGIYRPMLKKNLINPVKISLNLRIYANSGAKPVKYKTSSGLLFQSKWVMKNNLLIPAKGFEITSKAFDKNDTLKLLEYAKSLI